MLGVSRSATDFVDAVANGDRFEIRSSELAKQNAPASAADQSFADRMIKDHTKTTNELKSLVQKGPVKAELPQALDDAHQKKLDEWKGLSDAQFAKTYADDQVSGHKDAVSLSDFFGVLG